MLTQTIRESFHNLWASKQRSLLALLGIVIGTGSVIALGNIGVIAENHALEQIMSTGIDMVVIDIRQGGGSGQSPGVTVGDIEKLTEEVSDLDAAIPVATGGQPIVYRGEQLFGTTVASDPQLFDLVNLKLDKGRLLSRFDGLELFCVIGDRALQDAHNVKRGNIGDQVRVGSESYTVIGVLDHADQSPMLPFEVGSAIFVSFANAQRATGGSTIRTILARMAPGAKADTTSSQIESFFRNHLPNAPVRVQTATQMIEEMSQQVRTYSLLLGAIGSISLIVGGVGVMNVMLVSVTERRLEIGIRMAIGARRRDIKAMFLVESLVLSLVGGLIGTIVGVGGAAVFAGALGWTFVLAGYAIPLGAGVSSAVGVFFGIYPAATAARLNPADALRPL